MVDLCLFIYFTITLAKEKGGKREQKLDEDGEVFGKWVCTVGSVMKRGFIQISSMQDVLSNKIPV